MRAHLQMMPVLQAEESMREAERHLVGRALKIDYAPDVVEQWNRDMHHGDTPRRKAPPIPREMLGALGMGFEEVPPHV